MEGTIVDAKYQVVRLLGRGGMGAVYEAVHAGTGRRVALKVIIPEMLGEGDVLARFRREARASGAIESQHVVQVLDTGVDPATSSPYLVMEYLDGQDLAHRIATSGALAPEVVLRVVAQACSGLARAHKQWVLHRDIKPANLFLARREDNERVVKLLDFGIAKLRPDNLPASDRHKLTRSGSILGSPLYMSPEQILGQRDLDARSDIFSLGVTMYEALCGLTPCDEAANIGRLIIEICGGKGVPLERRAPRIPSAIYAIVAKATAVEVEHRYQTAAEMQAAIMALLASGSALTERMFAAPTDRRALADTQLPATEKSVAPDMTAPLLVVGSAPSVVDAATVAEPPGHPSLLPPALAATGSAFSAQPVAPRSASTLAWVGAALAIVALVSFLQLRYRGPQVAPEATSAPEASLAAASASALRVEPPIPAPAVAPEPVLTPASAPAASVPAVSASARTKPKAKPRKSVDCARTTISMATA